MTTSPGGFGTFEELAMPHFAGLYNYACWLTQDRAAAEDLVQETYGKALKGFPSFQQGANFHAWIFRILRNTFLTTQAGLKTAIPVGEDEVQDSSTIEAPEAIMVARADREAIVQALKVLPVHQRELIVLSDVEEMSYKELEIALNIPIGTVMSRLYRARKAMRTLLAAERKAAQ